MQAGFDGWILKPISFSRLKEIMDGLVDRGKRGDNLYQPGGWEHGGWFERPRNDAFVSETQPSQQPPADALARFVPSKSTPEDAAAGEDLASKNAT